MKLLSWIGAAIVTLGLIAASAQAETIRFAVTDVEGMEQLQREYGAFVQELEKVTGHKIEFSPVSNRTAAVEAMRAKQVDFVLTGPAEYVIFRKLTDAKPVVGWQRRICPTSSWSMGRSRAWLTSRARKWPLASGSTPASWTCAGLVIPNDLPSDYSAEISSAMSQRAIFVVDVRP